MHKVEKWEDANHKKRKRERGATSGEREKAQKRKM